VETTYCRHVVHPGCALLFTCCYGYRSAYTIGEGRVRFARKRALMYAPLAGCRRSPENGLRTDMDKPDLIIFDCDGVLVDSEIIAARVEAELLTAAGFEITPEELARTYAGLTFKDILLRIEEISGLPFQATLIDKAET